jgi:hypothetical protein
MKNFQCRYGCGTILHVNPSIKTKTGKLIPVQENGIPHECHLSPFFRGGKGKAVAKATEMDALSKIDEYAEREVSSKR